MSTQILAEHIKNVIDRLSEENPKFAHLQELNFLLVGRAGVGKSSTINSLLNRYVADVHRWERTTVSIQSYILDINGVNCRVYDTPGLCDDLETQGNDERYIQLMRAKVPNIHCLLYISPLYDTRIAHDEKTSLQLITRGYGADIWKYAIVVFTFANNAKNVEEYRQALRERSSRFRREIKKIASFPTDDLNFEIPCIAIDNHHTKTPDGKVWRETLVIEVFNRIQATGFAQFFLATLDSVKWPVTDSGANLLPNTKPPLSQNTQLYNPKMVIQIPPKSAETIQKRILEDPKIMTPFIEVGKALGAVFGGLTGLPSLVGGALGAVIGLILWLTGNKRQSNFSSQSSKQSQETQK